VVTAAPLKQGAPFLLDASLEDDGLSLRLDALKRVDGASKLGGHHYLPVLHVHGDKVGRREKTLLALSGLALAEVQGLRPAVGLVARGPAGRLGKVKLDTMLYRQAGQVLDEVKRLQQGGEPPRRVLNKHCPICEFRRRCHEAAVKADDISLLAGVGEKELKRYNHKGLFTLTQLAYTFRPRKRGKRVKRAGHIRYPALQALAIREKKVHVYGTSDVARKPVQIFLDAEGNEAGFVYLLGILVAEGDASTMHTLWADSQAEEVQLFDAFLDLLARYEDFFLFHFGSYERALLRRMRKVVKRGDLVDRALDKAMNVLSAIHANVYFPTFSNGLKDIGRFLGCTWSEPDASGLQSLVWRARWERGRDPVWKEKLLVYNAEDCAALKKVTEFVQAVSEAAGTRGAAAVSAPSPPAIAWADEIEAPSSRREWRRPNFALDDFDQVNRCAYFDYQRERVFLRTNKAVRRACQNARRRRKKPKLPVTKVVEVRADACPKCKGNRLTPYSRITRSKLSYDLKITAGGIHRQVIRWTAVRHQCEDCQEKFLPERYRRRDKHLHGLKSWIVYQHIVHRISLHHLETMLEDCFGLRVGVMEVVMIKTLMARRYRATLKGILARIVGGGLVHVDETHFNLKQGKGYVWVLVTMEDVVYLYSPNRETGFLQNVLRDFKGVLVSDFYPGYESLPWEQQACLVHLIRDMNADLMGSPYDEEFKALAVEFGRLLRPIMGTIDKYGLKKRHLHKHEADVGRFFHDLAARTYQSELAQGYQKRFRKNEGRLFTFLDHDNVPWNNNAAEHAIKAFARFRELYDGQMSEEGLLEYLILLSAQQTCKYRGVSFLKFLLSREEDVGTYCEARRQRNPPLAFEVYPEGFSRTRLNRRMAQETESQTP
jgi:predicted RecB family nuclease